MFAPMPTSANGGIDPDDIDRTIKPDDEHCAISRLLTLENTWHGQVVPLASINAAARRAREHGLLVHFDGARLMNACVKLGVSPAEMLAEVDSVSLCLSKGLGTPAGSILAGSKEMIKKAHRVRKLLGGGMRQVGILAAAGIHALDYHIDRLAEDHANALRLAERLAEIPQITVDPGEVETNMVFAGLPEGAAAPLQEHLRDRGILINRGEPQIRLVTHLDCRADEIDLFVEEVQGFFA